MKKLLLLSFAILLFLGMATTNATAMNVALNSNVTLNGTFFTGGWGGGSTVSEDTIVDDIFLPGSTQWDQGTVWWDSHTDTGQNITLDLGGVFEIDGFTVQADDNDAYILSYWDLSTASWQVAWDVPNYNYYGGVNLYGMQTRPDPNDNSAIHYLGSSIVTNALKFEGNANHSDLYFAVSEIQAFGTPVPEPGTMFLLGFGLIGLGVIGRKKVKS